MGYRDWLTVITQMASAFLDSKWMQRRHKWYGLDLDSSWPKSTLRSSSCCLLTFIFQPRCPISGFILTVSWPCGITRQLLAAHVFPVEAAAGHQKLINDWCRQDIGTGVRGRLAWLLQQPIIWCQRGPPATFAECTECGGKIHHWCKKIRSHLSCVAWSSLVTSRQRIIFKIATLMHQCVNGLAPSYLAADCVAISSMPGRRQLRSTALGQLYIPRTKTMSFGPRSFKVSGPTIWNDLPARLKDSSLSKNSFRKLFERFLFDRWPLHLRICCVY